MLFLRVLFLVFLVPISAFGQRQATSMHLSLDVGNIFLGAGEIGWEYGFHEHITARMGLGMRSQKTPTPIDGNSSFLAGYRNMSNQGAGLSAGVRFTDHYRRAYPYLGIDVMCIYFADTYLSPRQTVQRNRGLTAGVSTGVGFIMELTKKWSLDIALKGSYIRPPSDTRQNFYLPIAGYTLNGISEGFTTRSLCLQPCIALRFNIFSPKKWIPKESEAVLEGELEAEY